MKVKSDLIRFNLVSSGLVLKLVKLGRSTSNLVKMINRVKEAQTVSNVIKLGHIGFNWVKRFNVVKFGLVW